MVNIETSALGNDLTTAIITGGSLPSSGRSDQLARIVANRVEQKDSPLVDELMNISVLCDCHSDAKNNTQRKKIIEEIEKSVSILLRLV